MSDASSFEIGSALLQSHQGTKKHEINISKFKSSYTSRAKTLYNYARVYSYKIYTNRL